jgi:hypothetical protein
MIMITIIIIALIKVALPRLFMQPLHDHLLFYHKFKKTTFSFKKKNQNKRNIAITSKNLQNDINHNTFQKVLGSILKFIKLITNTTIIV